MNRLRGLPGRAAVCVDLFIFVTAAIRSQWLFNSKVGFVGSTRIGSEGVVIYEMTIPLD